MQQIIDLYEPAPGTIGTAYVREPDDGEPDQIIVHANGIAVDVIANADGSVYVEAYATRSGQQAVVQHAAIDRYTVRHPNLRLDTVQLPADDRTVTR